MIVQKVNGEDSGDIILFTKGADSVVEKFFNKENEADKKFVYQCIDEFS